MFVVIAQTPIHALREIHVIVGIMSKWKMNQMCVLLYSINTLNVVHYKIISFLTCFMCEYLEISWGQSLNFNARKTTHNKSRYRIEKTVIEWKLTKKM